jgi:hypothetical protein
MCPIAIGLILRMLALAQKSCLRFLGLEDDRGESLVSFMGAIAERLVV